MNIEGAACFPRRLYILQFVSALRGELPQLDINELPGWNQTGDPSRWIPVAARVISKEKAAELIYNHIYM